MAKRSAGDGTIVRKRRGKTLWWVARVQWPDGAHRERWRRTKAEAETARRQLIAERDSGKPRPPDKMTVTDLLTEWIAVKRSSWDVSTAYTRDYYTRQYLVPNIGAVLLRDLSVRHVERLWATLAKVGEGPDGKPRKALARGTIRTIAGMFSTAAKFGVERGLLPENVVKKAVTPAPIRTPMRVGSVTATLSCEFPSCSPGTACLRSQCPPRSDRQPGR